MRRIFTGLLVTAVASAGLVTANPATAAPTGDSDRAAKSIRTVLEPGILKKLHRANIDYTTLAPAQSTKVHGHPAVRFPIANQSKRAVKLRGGFLFATDTKHLKLRRLAAHPRTDRVSALVNGAVPTHVFNLRDSDRPRFGKYRLVLTRSTAGALNTVFTTKRFKPGGTFGYVKVRR